MGFSAIPPCGCYETFAVVPDWWVEIEPSRLLLVPSPLVPAYYTNHVLSAFDRKRGNVQLVLLSKVAAFSTIPLLLVARYDAWLIKITDPRTLADGLRMLVPLPQRHIGKIEGFGLLALLIRGTSFICNLFHCVPLYSRNRLATT